DAAIEALKRPQVTGVTIAAAKNDQIIFASGFGLANIETKEPVTVNTKMRTGSVSKVYTTALIGKLLEAKQLDIDLPVQTYVPSFPEKQWPITVRQMSAHMGGIRHYRGNEFSSTKHYPTVLTGLEIFQNDPLNFKPGTKSEYSSYAWNLISAALETAGQKPFLKQMQTDIFQELGMTNTVAEDVTKKIENLAAFHETRGTTTVIAPFVDNSYKWAGGGFIGTASDMARFGLAHTKPGFLSADTLIALRTEQQTSMGVDTGFGIGWMTAGSMKRRLLRNNRSELAKSFSDQLMWHSGGSMGAVALLLVDPVEQSAVALMANNSGSFSTILELGLNTLGLLQDR
ncbi:MAG: serine hydrolase domain-containing protein, partial [Kordiimonas sp.]